MLCAPIRCWSRAYVLIGCAQLSAFDYPDLEFEANVRVWVEPRATSKGRTKRLLEWHETRCVFNTYVGASLMCTVWQSRHGTSSLTFARAGSRRPWAPLSCSDQPDYGYCFVEGDKLKPPLVRDGVFEFSVSVTVNEVRGRWARHMDLIEFWGRAPLLFVPNNTPMLEDLGMAPMQYVVRAGTVGCSRRLRTALTFRRVAGPRFVRTARADSPACWSSCSTLDCSVAWCTKHQPRCHRRTLGMMLYCYYRPCSSVSTGGISM